MEIYEQNRKNLNFLLFALTCAGGFFWWFIGEFFYAWARDSWTALGIFQNMVIDGLYFAMLALFMAVFCLASESIIHSIVNADFFKMAVFIPPLRIILPLCALLVFLGAGAAQFAYEHDYAFKPPKLPAKTNAPKPVVQEQTQGFDDYYYVLDSSSSMEWNDPDNERKTLLGRIVQNVPDQKCIALVNFGESAEVLLPLQNATDDTKKRFVSLINSAKEYSSTDIMNALAVTSGILSANIPRKGVVIFISDGESEEHGFNQIISKYQQKNIPIFTILLAPNDAADGSALLQKIANATGGQHSTVRNFTDLGEEIVKSMQEIENPAMQDITSPGLLGSVMIEPVRSILSRREGKSASSLFFTIMHIVIIALIGLLFGWLLYTIFSYRRLLKPFLLSGVVSGVIAGIVLEAGFQIFQSEVLSRLLMCVILSTVFWGIQHLYNIIILKISRVGIYAASQNEKTDSGEHILESINDNDSQNTGILKKNEPEDQKASKGKLQ
jgi:Ca-activated chloride channel family protein